MTNNNWRGLAELIGVAAIVASLFFVGLQLKQSQDVALSQMDVAIGAIDVEITATIGDYADIWIRGNAGAALDDAEQAYYDRVIQNVRGRYLTSYRRNMRFGRENVARGNVRAMAIFLHTNPGALRSYVSRQDFMQHYLRKLGRPGVTENPFELSLTADLDALAQSQD